MPLNIIIIEEKIEKKAQDYEISIKLVAQV